MSAVLIIGSRVLYVMIFTVIIIVVPKLILGSASNIYYLC